MPRWCITANLMQRSRLWVDAVEKVGDGAPARNNRIASDDFLNRTCAFGGRLESILFRGPPQNPFSTASVRVGHSAVSARCPICPQADMSRLSRWCNPGNLPAFAERNLWNIDATD